MHEFRLFKTKIKNNGYITSLKLDTNCKKPCRLLGKDFKNREVGELVTVTLQIGGSPVRIRLEQNDPPPTEL